MKKLLFLVLAALTIVSCQKEKPEATPQFQDVSFSAIQVTPDGGLKNGAEEFDCVENTPTNAHFVIGNDVYDPALFELDGVLYTQSIKLPVAAEYCVTEFFLYDDVNENGEYDAGDVIVFATPEDDSHYGEYITDGIEYCFPVTAFTKAELQIEVLCFQEAYYTDFGFDWFAVTEIVVRQFCFFGDICITDAMYGAFDNSVYDLDANGLQADEEAQFRVIVSNDDGEVPYSPFDNVTSRGTGEALCVDYPDNLSQVDNFTFELQVWVPSTTPGTFVWQTYATFTSLDGGNLFFGTEDLGDNTTVKSFAVGDCSPMSNPIFEWLDPIAAPTFVLTDPSTQNPINEVNQNYPWYTYEINGLCIEFTLHNPNTWPAYFDFQIDGNPGTFYAGLSDLLITEGPLAGTYVGNLYSSTKVPAGQTVVSTRCGTSEIRVAIHFGAEQLSWLDWATFTAN